MEPAAVAEPRESEDLYVIAARERAARLVSDGKLRRARSWYEGVRADYAGTKK